MSDTFVHQRSNGEVAAAELRTTLAVRGRCDQLLERARAGAGWFEIDDSALDGAARQVVETTRRRHGRHPAGIFSCWRWFEAGGMDRRARLLEPMLAGMAAPERAHVAIDLATVCVLLGAGAGPDWKYTEAATGQTFNHAEGLAIATFHAFVGGLFSSDKDHPCQVDSTGLRALVTDHLAQALQVTPTNPLPRLEDRAILLRRLGELLSEEPEVYGENGRPGEIFDMIISPLGPDIPHTADVEAHDILSQLLYSLSGIWPGGHEIGGVPLGDCWRHPAVRGDGLTQGWIPFHTLLQAMTYSMLEPFAWAGVDVHGVDRLTGLADWRNGGLLLDTGVLRLKDAQAAQQVWRPGDEIIIEWRALTVSLLDDLAVRVRGMLGSDATAMPLARVMEGGTWAAGRELAQQLRGGVPPLRVHTEGIVF